MAQHADPTTPCSIARGLAAVGDRWSLLIVRELFQGVSRFDELQHRLGIARNVLATRLRHLGAEGILEKVPYQDRPLRFRYRLTAKGRDLFPVLLALMGWGDRWLAGGGAPPLTLVHRGCGRAVTPAVTCLHCGEALEPANTRARLSAALLAHTP